MFSLTALSIRLLLLDLMCRSLSLRQKSHVIGSSDGSNTAVSELLTETHTKKKAF